MNKVAHVKCFASFIALEVIGLLARLMQNYGR